MDALNAGGEPTPDLDARLALHSLRIRTGGGAEITDIEFCSKLPVWLSWSAHLQQALRRALPPSGCPIAAALCIGTGQSKTRLASTSSGQSPSSIDVASNRPYRKVD